MASTYLTKANPTGGDRTKGTISVWVKRSGSGSYQWIYSEHADGNHYSGIRFNNNDTLGVFSYDSGSAQIDINTNRVFRDLNAWYNIIVAWDTTDGTASDRVKIYVNGVRETSFSGSPSYPSSSQGTYFAKGGAGYPIRIGTVASSQYFDGLMSHFHRVDGQALAQTVFGSFDNDTGEWSINTNEMSTILNSDRGRFGIGIRYDHNDIYWIDFGTWDKNRTTLSTPPTNNTGSSYLTDYTPNPIVEGEEIQHQVSFGTDGANNGVTDPEDGTLPSTGGRFWNRSR